MNNCIWRQWRNFFLASVRCQALLLSSIALSLSLSLSAQAWSASRVVGYIAGFKDMRETIDRTDLSKLTHINLSFINPDAKGALISNDKLLCMPGPSGENLTVAELRYVVSKAHSAGVKVLGSVAGGVIPSCSGDWVVLLQPVNMPALVNALVQFAEDYKLDGLDVDIEGGLLTDIDNAGNYTPFIKTLSGALGARGKLLTCATASYIGGMIPVSSIRYFDFVNIMSYDAIGPTWGEAGSEHASLAQAQAHVTLWQSRGLSKDKLVLGVPFYGYGFGSYSQDYDYKNILAQFGPGAATSDTIGKACERCSYITYNGAETIRAKTHLALQQGSGVMIWELSQDVAGDASLLKVIAEEIK